jgi:hypothetical protein
MQVSIRCQKTETLLILGKFMTHVSQVLHCRIRMGLTGVARAILNGNGKLPWELELAVQHGVLINIDSEFDFANIRAAAAKVGKTARVLIRINPDVDPQVYFPSCLPSPPSLVHTVC